MNSDKILEAITIGVIFEQPGRVRPAWFMWNGRKIKVLRTNHAWSEREGIATLYHFSVTDGADTYHIVMNSDTQAWHLQGVHLQA